MNANAFCKGADLIDYSGPLSYCCCIEHFHVVGQLQLMGCSIVFHSEVPRHDSGCPATYKRILSSSAASYHDVREVRAKTPVSGGSGGHGPACTGAAFIYNKKNPGVAKKQRKPFPSAVTCFSRLVRRGMRSGAMPTPLSTCVCSSYIC